MLRHVPEHRIPVLQGGIRDEVLSGIGKAVVIYSRGGHIRPGATNESLSLARFNSS